MTTDELIQALREQTNTNGCWNDGRWNKCKRLMNEAADRLEELDERVAILQADTDPCRNCQEFVCDSCEYAKEGKE